MTPEEYTQLKAFARVDGAYLGVAWIISFAFYICGLSSPLLGLLGTLIAVLSPVFAAYASENSATTPATASYRSAGPWLTTY